MALGMYSIYLFIPVFIYLLCIKTSRQTCDAYQTEVQIQIQDYEMKVC